MMLSKEDRGRLEAGRLFGPLGLEEVGHLLDVCTIRTIGPGEHLLEPGVPNQHLYVVLDGELLVYPNGAGLPERVSLGLGDCVGEISLLHGHQPGALVVSARETKLLAIPHTIVWDMIERSHSIARNLLDILSGRLRSDNLTLLSGDSRSLEFEVAASVDALTGLHNRRWMQDAFPRAMQRCEHDATALCLMLVDIDQFRRFNNEYGHHVGDGVLRMVARKLAGGLRSQDLLVRYSGEVFALTLPHTTLDEGFQIAERLRQSVAAQTVRVGGKVVEPVTISCGIASMGLDDTLANLLAAADGALSRAKDNGRNRVERATR